jgi:hypothetical protein
MIRRVLILGIITLLKVKAKQIDSEDLLKAMMNQKISNELMLTDPFWTKTMIPVAVCLAVVLLILSIFAVSIVAIKALNDSEPAFATFAPPGFDALWERNIQAELGVNNSRRPPSSLETILEEDEDIVLVEVKKPIKIPETRILSKPAKVQNDNSLNIPMEPPKPSFATNSKTGLETIQS